MRFEIRPGITGKYTNVELFEGSTQIDLGLHDENERKALAAVLRGAADDLDPQDSEPVGILMNALSELICAAENITGEHVIGREELDAAVSSAYAAIDKAKGE